MYNITGLLLNWNLATYGGTLMESFRRQNKVFAVRTKMALGHKGKG